MSVAESSAAQAVKQAAPRLPISKCKRIAKTDPEYMLTSQGASAAVAFATELFVQALAEDALARSQLERASGARLRLQYDELAQCVATMDRYSFLSDVVPQTQSLAALTRENRVRYTTLAPGQTTLPFRARDDPGDADEQGQDQGEDDDNEQES
ncbi:LAFE_0F08526g1_1 [Lachancea fermentati]|uniref:LAFE_0F08526g1_1 n=1 Tax=Lachancea fermentati TaxID=4955 RepID=A0A1G4MFG8_LACFM|nr:LAFE_0F08526g1_1 [Lachancea fermentati]